MESIGVRLFFVLAIIITCTTARIANLGVVGHAHYLEKWFDLYGCIVSKLWKIEKLRQVSWAFPFLLKWILRRGRFQLKWSSTFEKTPKLTNSLDQWRLVRTSDYQWRLVRNQWRQWLLEYKWLPVRNQWRQWLPVRNQWRLVRISDYQWGISED